jgi:hypothetical protein
LPREEDAGFAVRTERRIDRSFDEGLIEDGFAYQDGEVIALEVSRILLQEPR